MTKLIVSGDSWGLGSWSTATNKQIEGGDNYLTDKLKKIYTEVINLSIGGISNTEILNNLEDWLKTNTIGQFEEVKFLVIQTEPLRDMIRGLKYSIEDDCSCIFEKISFNNYVNTEIDLYYYSLNFLAKRYNIKINVSGGCSDITNCIAKYPNLHVACPSVYKLILSDHIQHVTSCTYNISQIINDYSDSNSEIVSAHYKKQEITDAYAGNIFGWYNDNHLTHKGIDLWVSQLNLI
jgi:hypothetical protein